MRYKCVPFTEVYSVQTVFMLILFWHHMEVGCGGMDWIEVAQIGTDGRHL